MSHQSFDLPASPSSVYSFLDVDDSDCWEHEEWNMRVTPHWPKYKGLLETRGFRLDTIQDVKQYYKHRGIDPPLVQRKLFTFPDNELCPDAGLPDNLFRGACMRAGARVVVKAVHLQSRELDVTRFLSTLPVRNHPMNHSIPVLDLIDIEQDQIGLIIMEEWLPVNEWSFDHPEGTFLKALRQCIEHVLFLHSQRVAHLDISASNILANDAGDCAYIDYEMSRHFDDTNNPCMDDYKGTEVPPECEKGLCTDPYKIDVWALAVLMLRTCKMTGHCTGGLVDVIKPMLNENPDARPTLEAVLASFDAKCTIHRPPDRRTSSLSNS